MLLYSIGAKCQEKKSIRCLQLNLQVRRKPNLVTLHGITWSSTETNLEIRAMNSAPKKIPIPIPYISNSSRY